MKKDSAYLYGGITGVTLPVESFPLGEGLELRQTYAHLFSTNLMAFAPPGPAGYHPAPWKATKGGFGYDIEVELVAPGQTALGKSFDAKDLIWWIAALLRMAGFPYLYVPVISDHPFQDIPTLDQEPTLVPVETEPRIFRPTERRMGILDTQNLEWVAATWLSAGPKPKVLCGCKSI
jgi:hypothetical protein